MTDREMWDECHYDDWHDDYDDDDRGYDPAEEFGVVRGIDFPA